VFAVRAATWPAHGGGTQRLVRPGGVVLLPLPGPALASRKVTIWVDETSLHVLTGGARVKTLPSRLGVAELARLAGA